MSTTDQRTGFRLPWSTEGRARDSATDPEAVDGANPDAAEDATDATAEAQDTAADTAADGSGDMAWPEVDRRMRQIGRRAGDRADATLADIAAGAPPVPRKTNALMAGLSKAMHTAAEGARAETLERLAADAAARTESIKASGADEATAIKQAADENIAGIREWSKNELARIREETEAKITARRESLERQTSAHATRVEARIERVNRVVATFEATMADFFEILLAETDPARVALLAEQLPEAPSLDVDDEPGTAYEPFEAAAAEPAAAIEDDETAEAAAPEPAAASEAAEGVAEAVAHDPLAVTEAFETAPSEATTPAETDFDAEAAAAAEAEALAAASDAPLDDDSSAGASALSEEALAARLARMETADGDAGAIQTELIVTGLVSVAGIAGFKRAVTRMPGVTSVGVTSGPGGEFVYSVTHAPETDFRAAIAALTEFSAHIVGEADGSFQVTAADSNPDSN